jgi:hypothetical protein
VQTVLTAPGAPDLGFTCPNEIILRLVQCFAFRGITCLGLTSDRCTSKLTAGSSVGRLGPYMSASSSPTRRPLLDRVTAKLAATVLLPTPPGAIYYLDRRHAVCKASNSIVPTFTARHTNDVTNLRQRSILHRNRIQAGALLRFLKIKRYVFDPVETTQSLLNLGDDLEVCRKLILMINYGEANRHNEPRLSTDSQE